MKSAKSLPASAGGPEATTAAAATPGPDRRGPEAARGVADSSRRNTTPQIHRVAAQDGGGGGAGRTAPRLQPAKGLPTHRGGVRCGTRRSNGDRPPVAYGGDR